MTREEMRNLKPGQLIRHKHASEAVVVTANYGTRLTAVRTYDVLNPKEWDVITQLADSTGGKTGQHGAS
jgi:hypothetical protein